MTIKDTIYLFLVMMGIAHTGFWIIYGLKTLYDYTLKQIAKGIKNKK